MAETTWQYTVQDYSSLLTYTASNGHAQVDNLDPEWNNTCPYQVLPNGQYYNKAVCDLGSTHTTNVAGASVSLTFYGNGVTFFGSVSNGMSFDVNVDGAVSGGRPTGQTLASVSGLAQGNHSVMLTAKPSSPNPESLFLFDHAVVTVGTGLTGANVRRVTFQDSDQMFTYTPLPNVTTIEMYSDWHIPSDAYNTTWRIADTVEFQFSGSAILMYGGSFSWYNTSANQFSVGNQTTGMYSLNSAMPKYPHDPNGPNFLGNMYTSALIFANTNLPSGNLIMYVDSNREPGLHHMNLDYIEIISVTGGSPLSSHGHHLRLPVLAAVIVGPIIGVTLLAALVFVLFKRKRTSKSRYPLDLSDGYRGSALDIAVALPRPGDAGNYVDDQPWQSPAEAGGSSASGRMPYVGGPSWASSMDGRFGSAPSLPATKGPDQETEVSSSTGAGGSTAQEVRELRREVDHLTQLLAEAPPEYTPAIARAMSRATTGKR